MLNTDHCNLCDNMLMDFNYGAMCNLTNKKPDFSQKCNVIKLDALFKVKIEVINIEYEAVKKTKIDAYGLFIFYALIGLTCFTVSYLFGKHLLETYEISRIMIVPFLIFGLGVAPLVKAIGRLNFYRTSIDIATKKKNNLDTIAKMYGYQYTINIKEFKDSLGNYSYDTDVKLRRTSNTII